MAIPIDHPLRKLATWAVHAYTALGIPLALYSGWALFNGEVRGYFIALVAACFVDATDGVLARKVQVKKVVPWFDGRRMDDIIDFLHYAFLPALSLPLLGILPPEYAWWSVVPVLASGYGFCQDVAKTDDSFVGFPSYWNILVVYLYFLKWGATINLVFLLVFSVAVFIPIHYVYPSRTPLLKPLNILLGMIWGLLLFFACTDPFAPRARLLVQISLFYPVYYLIVSGVHHWQVMHADVGTTDGH
jgi:phosphatidylcholine synthase